VRVVGLVPRRADGARRDQLWRWARERWPFEVVEGSSPDGPFNRSAAINDAARKAGDWDIAAIIDADTLVPQPQLDLALRLVEQADESAVAQRDGLAVLPFTHYCLVSRKESDRLLAGRELPGQPVPPVASGVVRADAQERRVPAQRDAGAALRSRAVEPDRRAAPF
jgi:hypothetical protein